MKCGLFVWTIFIALFVSFSNRASASAPPEIRSVPSISACTAWLNARSTNDDPVFRPISKRLGCYDGEIDSKAGANLVEWLSTNTSEKPLLVVRSRGGPVSVGLSMGKAIAGNETTVFIFDVCGSSCANYVFSAAEQRIILPGSLVLFHGGMSEALITGAMELAREEVPIRIPDPDKADANIRKIERTIRKELEDQRALMRQAGVEPEFFERYGEFDIGSLSDDQCTSGDARNFVFLTKDQYRRLGIEVSGEIVDSVDRAEEIVVSLDIGDTAVCFAPEILFSKKLAD